MHQDLMVQSADFLWIDLRWQLTNQAWVTPLIRQGDSRGGKRRHDRDPPGDLALLILVGPQSDASSP